MKASYRQKYWVRRKFLNYCKAVLLGGTTWSLISQNNQALTPPSSPNSSLETLEKRIPQLMRQKNVPGISLAIVKEGQVFFSRGFGVTNRKQQQPIINNTIFAAASLGKPLFAYGVLKLVEQGKLNLDTPLTEYTETPYIKDPRIKLITARMVLSHTTGFPNWSGSKPVWIQSTPGTKFGYSGEGYIYLQQVVEKITRQPLGVYIRENLLLPLGMKSSSYIWEKEYEGIASYGHDSKGNPQAMARPKQAMAAGSLRTTATDFAQLLIAMMTTGTLDSPFLTSETINEMIRPQISISKSLNWGLGWGVENTTDGDFFWHWGDSNIFTSFTFGSRNLKTGIVILTNSSNGLQIGEQIVRLAIGGQHPAFRLKLIRYS